MSETDLEMELKAWRLLLEDDAYRLDFPDDYHRTLIQRADELLLHEWITRDDWQLLKSAADDAHGFTLESLAREQRDCLKTSSLRLPKAHEDIHRGRPPVPAATSTKEKFIMTEEKKEQPDEQANDNIPAHSTEQERERLKDFNKDGIPPGSC